MNQTEEQKIEVFTLIQRFLKNPPVIIWGSGATIPYGLPSMDDLKKSLKSELGDLGTSANLETELGKIDDINKIDIVKKIIRNEVSKKQLECLKKAIQNMNYFKSITDMIKKFYDIHPRKIDIVTTNYDCILEYALSKSDYNFTDGFTGKPLSNFHSTAFGKKEIVNLIKVHGSLNWLSDENSNTFCLPYEYEFENLKYTMVLPAKERKYYETFIKEPYRTLIGKSDDVIENANSFLVVGFGFNDEHLTPKVDSKIKTGTPIVIITEKATDSCMQKLNNAEQYCLFEKDKNETKVMFKKNNSPKKSLKLNGNYWKLNKFMEVL
ncbi:MAG: SIR2 family protein [Bdellovibrionales bacterium]|nr:SIR2 family protein [Bdellovibrionales bacterium]